MTEGGTRTFSDPDGYAAAFDDVRVNLTIAGAGDFRARLTRFKLNHLEVYWCYENLPRIAYISLLRERTFLSFPVATASLRCGGLALRNGDMVLHGGGERVHQRSNGVCQWGLLSLPPEQLADGGKALTGRLIASPPGNRILRPSRSLASRFQSLFRQACHLAESRKELIECPEITRALEQEMLHAIIHCLAANEADDHSRGRHHHAVIMVRFEEALSKRIDQKLNMPTLCAQIGVAERTLRMCCAEFLGVSPTRYLLLQRLNKARAALRRADPSKSSVAEVARNHQFLELGRFSVTYRTTFGESPSTTLQRAPRHRAQDSAASS
ncbi:helix-turn-helix transcriptional regulator [Bradyrhizobium sp. CB1650]|uniref:helix-turn-helix transcriptional regulator n=1 Tax=Bradyrhizobium sp. CB1650 TaxID=3039153 RepID=UPI002434B44A|nr:helix-turn-helix transcriptional regulator [Bradyrhizobium sp. CB1650]WGD55018.1 helix-turn-helix transcriptional regulator [Bradyrhizobium sp. CB1650]